MKGHFIDKDKEPYHPNKLEKKEYLGIEGFFSVDMRVGIIIEVEEFPEMRKPSYKIKVNFGVLNLDNTEKKDLEKIILCDVQTEIYPDLETSFLNLVHNSGHPAIKLEKKIDFMKLYNERFN